MHPFFFIRDKKHMSAVYFASKMGWKSPGVLFQIEAGYVLPSDLCVSQVSKFGRIKKDKLVALIKKWLRKRKALKLHVPKSSQRNFIKWD